MVGRGPRPRSRDADPGWKRSRLRFDRLSQDQFVAFARVLTDAAYIALLLDVIVSRDRRGTGLGRMLMDTVIAHPTIASVETVELVCPPDLAAFYSRWGFVDHSGGSRLLRRTSSRTLLDLDSVNR